MAQQLDYINYLSKEIGPRPAGTEEEQQAALYIAETLQTEAGFTADIEDVVSSSNIESPKTICSIITVVVALIAAIFTPFTLPAAIIAAISAAIYAAEALGNPIITKFLAKGASQNIVARYVPAGVDNGRRSRKVILVAHYDSGKVKPKLVNTFESMGVPWPMVCLVAMVFIPVFLLIRVLFFGEATGVVVIILNILLILAAVLAVLPAVKAILYRTAPFSEGANDNAAGVAAVIGVAKAVSKGLMNEVEIDRRSSRIHGERAAYDEGLIPEGTELTYHAESNVDDYAQNEEPQGGEGGLAAAKAAIAAMTGTPVSSTNHVEATGAAAGASVMVGGIKITEIPTGDTPDSEARVSYFADSKAAAAAEDVAGSINAAVAIAASSEPAEQAAQEVADVAAAPTEEAATPEPEIVIDENVPDWFAAAQRKAKRSSQKPNTAQRSRYADALDSALKQSSAYFDEANELVMSESEDRMRARSADIVEIDPSQPGDKKSTSADQPVTASGAVDEGSKIAEGINLYMPDMERFSRKSDDAQPEVAEASTKEAPVDEFAEDAATTEIAESINPAASGAEAAPAATDGATAAFAPIVMTAEELAAVGANGEAIESARTDTASEQPARKQRNMMLPDFASFSTETANAAEEQPLDFEVHGQSAPLAGGTPTAASQPLDGALPSIAGTGFGVADQTSPSKSGSLRALRTKLPSLSGAIERVGEDDIPVSNVSTIGSFVAAEATGSLEPVGDELLSDLDNPEDAYIDDADDSDIQENYTETGAFAGPGYVDMPKSRVRRFFDRFHFGSKNDAADEETPQEWLDVEDEFDPRAVGKERGGWESFRDETIEDRRAARTDEPQASNNAYTEEYGDYAEDAYDNYSDNYVEDDAWSDDNWEDDSWNNDRRWQGGAMSRVRLGRVSTRSSEDVDAADAAAALDEDIETPEEVKRIYQFRNPNFETEIWFVALGSEVDYHDGIRTFIDKHKDELRGAVIVDVEAVGAGTLSYAQKEGSLTQQNISSRLKRYLQKASKESGVPCESVDLVGSDSAASIATAAGVQALHLLGVEEGQKALTTDDIDVIDNIDEQLLEENTYFIEELVKSI